MSDEPTRARRSSTPRNNDPPAQETKEVGRRSSTTRNNNAILVEEAVRRVAQYCPAWLKPIVEKSAPVINFLASVLNFVFPYIKKAYAIACQLYVKLQPYDPELLATMLFGFVLMFFGGFFVTTIACVEAFRITGWAATRDSLAIIWANFKRFQEENEKDDLVDENKDGIVDVQQISPSQLVTRKTLLLLRACDPQELSRALTAIYAGSIAALAALKVQFAKTIALGAAIGDIVYKPANKFLEPLLKRFIPEEYHKWIPVVLSYVCKSVGVSIAWQVQRLLSSVHSAMRGATIFCDTFAQWADKRGWHVLSKGYWDEALAAVCSIFGVYFQIKNWFAMPWWLTLPLFPMVLLETFLQWFISFY